MSCCATWKSWRLFSNAHFMTYSHPSKGKDMGEDQRTKVRAEIIYRFATNLNRIREAGKMTPEEWMKSAVSNRDISVSKQKWSA